MVCRNGGGTKNIWECKDLCGFEATEQKCLERNSPNPKVDVLLNSQE